MKTLIFQSHADKPPYWLTRCTDTVRGWAEARGYDYRLLGDELFEGIPHDVVRKAASVLPLTDFGRLLWIERFLKDWDRVAWIDSDVVIFNPDSFTLDEEAPHLVCREVLVKMVQGKTVSRVSFNPTVLMFNRNSKLLPQWLERIRKIAAKSARLNETLFGRDLLDTIGGKKGFPAISSVGHFSVSVLREIVGDPHPIGATGKRIEAMMESSGEPFAAANLCGHHKLSPAFYLRVVERLLETRGAIVNDKLTP